MELKEKEERIEQLEKQLFFLNMKDYWTTVDFQKNTKINNELKELKAVNNNR